MWPARPVRAAAQDWRAAWASDVIGASLAQRKSEGPALRRALRLTGGPGREAALPPPSRNYLISTLAPCSSRAALIFSASSLAMPSLTALGAASTRSLASLRPRPVSSRTTLMTGILFGPISVSVALNSLCSSAAAAGAPPAAAAGAAARSCRGSGGNAVALLELLDELGKLENGHAVDCLEKLILGDCCSHRGLCPFVRSGERCDDRSNLACWPFCSATCDSA